MLKKRLKKLKQKPAVVANFVPLLICLVCVVMVMHIFIGWMDTISIKDEADTLVREYILKMEAEGYLTEDNRLALENALENAGVTVLSWGDTTFAEVGYGEEIVLEIQGSASSRLIVSKALGKLGYDNDEIQISLRKTSTAKH